MKQKAIGKVSFLGGQATDFVAQFSLLAGDFTTLNTAPLTLIQAPTSPLTAIEVTRAVFRFKWGTTAFTGGGPLSLVYHGGITNLLTGAVAAATVLGTADSCVSFGAPASALVMTPNVGVDLLAGTANFVGGDSTAIVTIWYTVYKLLMP